MSKQLNICSDNLVTLKKLPNNSVDCIVTDPPYGLSFMQKNWDKAIPSVKVWSECLRVLKHGAFAFIMSSPRFDCLSHMGLNLEDAGFNVSFSPIFWAYASGFPKSFNISKAVDKQLGFEREPVPITGGMHLHQDNGGINFYGKQVSDTPISATAKKFHGSYAGYQPKPAVEVIIVAMKPLSEKSYTEQVMANGKGVTWLNQCRIPVDKDREPRKKWMEPSGKKIGYTGGNKEDHVTGFSGNATTNPVSDYAKKGRFPSNLLVSNNILDDGTISKNSSGIRQQKDRGTEEIFPPELKSLPFEYYGDSGGFSRFFSLDKWWEQLPFLIVPKPSKTEKEKGLDKVKLQRKWLKGGGGTGITASENIVAKNIHPTCKPVKLMSYLVMLGTREKDFVLDPYVGSGTTSIACKILRRNSLGIDISQEYINIANKRLQEWKINKSIREWE